MNNKDEFKDNTIVEEPSAEEAADIQKTEKPKKKRDRNISAVVNATGWTREYAREQMKSLREQYGLSFKDYKDKKFYKLPETEQRRLAKELQSIEVNTNNSYEDMSLTSGMEIEDLKARFEAAEQYGVTLREFEKNDLWNVPNDKLEEACNRLLESRDVQEEYAKVNRSAARLRKKLITPDEDNVPAEKVDNRYPAPVRAACACLGKYLPPEATMDKRLEEYIGKLDGSLDGIRKVLGEGILPDTPDVNKEYEKFHKRFSTFEPLSYSDTDMAVLFTDCMLFCKDYGFNNSDYLEYKFYEKEIPERNKYMSQGYRGYIRKVCNTNRALFMSKPRFNRHFASLLHRDWTQVTSHTYDEFMAFVGRHDRFFRKPVRGAGGTNNAIFSTQDHTKEELYEICKRHESIIEEIVVQHPDMAAFSDSVANTLRLYTITKVDGEPVVAGAMVKFSRPGIFADNLMQGGLGALVDVETGVVVSDGVDFNCKIHTEHPDSHIPFKGFQIPVWDKVVQTALDGARLAMPWNRHVGWDIAITAAGEAEIIEGNSWPDISLLQVVDCVGKKDWYYQYIHDIAASMGIPDSIEIPENIIDVVTEEDSKNIRRKLELLNQRKLVANKYKDNMWLEQYEIKGPDYDYRERPLDLSLCIKRKPKRVIREEDTWICKRAKKDRARILFTGDITCFEKQIVEAQTEEGYDFKYAFDYMKEIFKQADLVVGNLETMIVPEAPYRTELLVSEQAFHCNAPLEFLDAVRRAGFDCLTNANNHDYDTGAVGIGVTIDYIEQMGMVQTGTFKSDKKHYEMFEVGGIRIGLVALTHYHNYKEDNITEEGLSFLLNTYTEEYARELYEQAKQDGADIVILCMHWGVEYQPEANVIQQKMREELTGIGYDVIIGSHPHVLQSFDIVDTGSKKIPVYYSVGNFLTNHTGNERGREIVACVDLNRDEDGIHIECSYIPVIVSNDYTEKKYAIVPLRKDSEYEQNRNDVQLIEAVLGDKIGINEDIVFTDHAPLPADEPEEDDDQDEEKPVKKKRKSVRIKKDGPFPVHYDAGKFIYDIYEDHAVVKGINPENRGSSLTITRMVKGRRVRAVAPGAFSGRGVMKKLNFTSGITSISERCFQGCPDLEGFFQEAETITRIEKQAFEDCPKLTCIVAKKGLKVIEEKAFRNCKALKSAKLYDGVEYIADDAFEGCDKLVFYCTKDSVPYRYAVEHGFEVRELEVSKNVHRPQIYKGINLWALKRESTAK